jgi:hypothetical protein
MELLVQADHLVGGRDAVLVIDDTGDQARALFGAAPNVVIGTQRRFAWTL